MAHPMIGFRFVNVVWGEEYTDTFVNVCLPSTLSSGNLEYMAANSRSSYCIYTTTKDAETIVKSPAGRRLAQMMPLDLVRIDAPFPVEDPNAVRICSKKYGAMSLCHTHFIKRHGSDGSAMVFLSPDLVCADGSFRRMLEIAQSGKRLLMMCALRLAKESFIPVLRQHICNGVMQPVAKRDLVGLAADHLHPETESLIWDSGRSNAIPSLLLWKAPAGGMMLRAFHLHPLMVRPAVPGIVPTGTLDDDYVARACPNPSDEYIVEDSDDLVAYELSRRNSRSEFIRSETPDAARIAHWARTHANPRHQGFLKRHIRLHSAPLSEAWRETADQSDRTIREIQATLASKPSPVLV